MLRGRLERGDITAARTGLRVITESLLRHAARELEVSDEAPHKNSIEDLRGRVMPKLRQRVSREFDDHLHSLQRFGNSAAHARIDDVYGVPHLGSADPWDTIASLLPSLLYVMRTFVGLYPPPPAFSKQTSLAGVGATPPPAPLPARAARSAARGVTASSIDDLGDLTIGHMRQDPELLERVAAATGWSQARVRESLAGHRGNLMVKNVFPLQAGARRANKPRPTAPSATGMQYESIGHSEVREVRGVLEKQLATLTGLSPLVVRQRLKAADESALIKRVFSEWYSAPVIARLSVATARAYGMHWLLARHLQLGVPKVESALKSAVPSTELGVLFPALGKAR